MNKLNESHPDLAQYLIEHTSTKSKPTTNTIIDASSSEPANFLYFNNSTKTFEGISLHSTQSVFKLSSNKLFKVVTQSSQLTNSLTDSSATTTKSPVSTQQQSAPSKTSKLSKIVYVQSLFTTEKSSKVTKTPKIEPIETSTIATKTNYSKANILPFFHQFIYTVKLLNTAQTSDKSKSLVDLLNEQSVESSRIRVNLLRNVCRQLDLNPATLRFNWIEKLKSNFNSFAAQNTDNHEEDEYTAYYDSNYDEEASSYDENEPELVMPDKLEPSPIKKFKAYSYLLVSFSSAQLLELQKSYFLMSKSAKSADAESTQLVDLKAQYAHECVKFFELLNKKHQNTQFRINLVNLTSGNAYTNETLLKVQFLKACILF